jgi:hypothetical protein
MNARQAQDEELRLRRLALALDEQQQAVASAASMVELAVSMMNDTMKRVSAQIERLGQERGQPTVLVRHTPGPAVRRFHFSASPCGRATDRTSFLEMPQGEAEAQGLTWCPKCQRQFNAQLWHERTLPPPDRQKSR